MTALVFEDDRNLAAMIIALLSEIMDTVKHCETLAEVEAYRATLAECPDLAWYDLKAPGNTVQEAFDETAALRKLCPDSIIVVMTGIHLPEITRKAMEAGADNVAFKPFRFSVIDLARLIVVGAINAMHRGASSSPRILENVCSMALKYFQHHHHTEENAA